MKRQPLTTCRPSAARAVSVVTPTITAAAGSSNGAVLSVVQEPAATGAGVQYYVQAYSDAACTITSGAEVPLTNTESGADGTVAKPFKMLYAQTTAAQLWFKVAVMASGVRSAFSAAVGPVIVGEHRRGGSQRPPACKGSVAWCAHARAGQLGCSAMALHITADSNVPLCCCATPQAPLPRRRSPTPRAATPAPAWHGLPCPLPFCTPSPPSAPA